MFKNVLVGVDGRPNGRDAIALACKLMDLDGKLTLAHVHSGKLRPSHAITPGMVAEEREASHDLLEQERAAADVTADLLSIESMSPGRGLHEQAEEQNAELLVVGSCGHGVFGRAMLGDDTRAALNGAPCAVAVASRGYAGRAAGQVQIVNVGVAYNASPGEHRSPSGGRQTGSNDRGNDSRYGGRLDTFDRLRRDRRVHIRGVHRRDTPGSEQSPGGACPTWRVMRSTASRVRS